MCRSNALVLAGVIHVMQWVVRVVILKLECISMHHAFNPYAGGGLFGNTK